MSLAGRQAGSQSASPAVRQQGTRVHKHRNTKILKRGASGQRLGLLPIVGFVNLAKSPLNVIVLMDVAVAGSTDWYWCY